jgi:hypothetical protein
MILSNLVICAALQGCQEGKRYDRIIWPNIRLTKPVTLPGHKKWGNLLPHLNLKPSREDGQYIVRLVGQVITVSLETKLVKSLPPLDMLEE